MSSIANGYKVQVSQKDWLKELKAAEAKNKRTLCQICKLNPGRHKFNFGTTKLTDPWQELGTGISLYLRFLKLSSCCFFLFFLISLPQLLLCVMNHKISSYYPLQTIKDLTVSTTIGVMQLQQEACFLGRFNQNYRELEVTLTCESGKLDNLKSFKMGTTNSNIFNCLLINHNEVHLYYSYRNIPNNSHCEGKQSCQFNISLLDFGQMNSDQKVYASAQCIGGDINTGLFSIEFTFVAQYFASFDLAIMLLFLYMQRILTYSESLFLIKFKGVTPSINYYSIQISNIPSSTTLNRCQLLQKIKMHLEGNLQQYLEEIEQGMHIYDIQCSENRKFYQKLAKLDKQNNSLMGLIRTYFSQARKNHNAKQLIDQIPTHMSFQEFETLHEDILSEFKNNSEADQLKKYALKIVKNWGEINEKFQQISKQQETAEIKYIWVTFTKQLNYERVFVYLRLSLFERIKIFFGFGQSSETKLFLNKHRLDFKVAPSANNIIWENMGASMKKRLFFGFISIILAGGIIYMSYYFITTLRLTQDFLLSQYPAANCSEAIFNNVSHDIGESYKECYCRKELNNSSQQFEFDCQEWYNELLGRLLLPIPIALLLMSENYLIDCLLKYITKYEMHQNYSNQLASYMIKLILAQFLNLFTIFVSSTTQYGDINYLWCSDAGVTIILILTFNLAYVPMTLLISNFYLYLKRRWYYNSKTSEYNVGNKEEYLKLTLGTTVEIEERYAHILSTIFICMTISSALPILHLMVLLTLLLTYWIDKSLFLSTYHTFRLDETLSSITRKIILLALIIHLFVSVYVYSSQSLFYKNSAFMLAVFDQETSNIDHFGRLLIYLKQIAFPFILFIFMLGFCRIIYCCRGKRFTCFITPLFDSAYKSRNCISLNPEITTGLSNLQIEKDLKFARSQQKSFPVIYDKKISLLEQKIGQIDLNNGQNTVKIVGQTCYHAMYNSKYQFWQDFIQNH